MWWGGYVGVALGLLTLSGLLLLGRWGFDDPYITLRYAKNLLAGHGFVYNVGQRALSTTAPLYGILVAGLGLIWADLPTVSNFLSALSVVLSAACLFAWSQGHGQPAVGMIAALLLSLSPLLIPTLGAETCFYVLLILGGLTAYDRSRLTLAAGTLAFAVMIRPDGVMAAVALGLYHLIRRRPVPWRPLILYIVLVGSWYAGLWLYSGSPVPITLRAKQLQGQMAISTRFGPGFLDLLRQFGREPFYWLHGILAVIGLGQVVTRARHWAPLLLWTVLYFAAYTALGVSRYFWYYAPLAPAFAVLVAEGTVVLVRTLARLFLPRVLMIGLTGLLLVVLLAPLVMGVMWAGWYSDPRLDAYREVGEWLAAHTLPQASVGALEVGIIGYYAGRPMIDFAGLIQPDVARRLTPASTYQDSAVWAIQTYRPDYVVLPAGSFPDLVGSDWFTLSYAPVRDFVGDSSQLQTREPLWLTLHRRRESP